MRGWLLAIWLGLAGGLMAQEAAPAGTGVSPREADPPETVASTAGGQPPLTRIVFRVPELDNEHVLGPGDKVSYAVLEDREREPRLLVVTDSGELDVPYLGRVQVAGRTCRTAAAEIKGLLEKDLYYQASVVVGLNEASQQRSVGKVYLWGRVRNPGPIDIPANETLTVSKAILRAGGFGEFANRRRVRLMRRVPDSDRPEIRVVDITAVLDKGSGEDPVLQADDTIVVEQRVLDW